MLVLSGCILVPPKNVPPNPAPLEQALEPLRQGDENRSIRSLEHLLKDPDYRCRSAFYLYSIDGFKSKYLKIMRSEKCSKQLMPELRLINELAAPSGSDKSKNLYHSCKKSLKSKEAQINKLKKELDEMETENSRLRFELNKIEEIRRETEKLRLK